MSEWYVIEPLDTLFFRGSEPMEAGQLTATALFPPPVSVIQGALRAQVLRQHGVSGKDYIKGKAPSAVLEGIGRADEDAPFQITGVFFTLGERFFAPAPAAWFVDMVRQPTSGAELTGKQVVVPGAGTAFTALDALVTGGLPPVVVTRHEAFSLGGFWVDVDLLTQPAPVFAPGQVLLSTELYDLESRVGIGLDANRKVLDGKLYSAGHIRLREGVRLVVGLDREIGLAHEGRLILGGELKVCRYQSLAEPRLPQGQGKWYVSLAPTPLTTEMLDKIVCSPKPVTLAGWDMAKGFHKPSRTWLPSGAVFTAHVNASCVPLA
jgi:CRISPR-associated protein Cmr3